MTHRRVFVTGATGYMGCRLIPRLLERGHHVSVLSRSASERRLPQRVRVVLGDALDASSFSQEVVGSDTFVHLVGVAHPAPWKGPQFRAIDLVSVRAAVTGAKNAGVRHLVYVSVAQPAPVMRAYVAVRAECEELIRTSGLSATLLRPWYVLGPDHWWPAVLLPVYWLLERIPSTTEGAQRLGLLSLEQMVRALIWAIEHPSDGVRNLTVPDIRTRAAALTTPPAGMVG